MFYELCIAFISQNNKAKVIEIYIYIPIKILN